MGMAKTMTVHGYLLSTYYMLALSLDIRLERIEGKSSVEYR